MPFQPQNSTKTPYPFGSVMPERAWVDESRNYRFDFNGFENDDEIKGKGKHSSFGDYGYDPRVVKRWRPDPLMAKYPHVSPYAVFANNPLIFFDSEGKDVIYSAKRNQDGSIKVFVTVNAKMIDLTTSGISSGDMHAIKDATMQKANEVFSKSFTGTNNEKISVEFKLNITIVDNLDDVKKDDHIIAFVDDIKPSHDKPNLDPAGLTFKNGHAQVVEKQGHNLNKTANIILHELGHNLGLEDKYETDATGKMINPQSDNLMGAGGKGTKLDNSQLNGLFYRYANLGKEKEQKFEDRNPGKVDSKKDLDKLKGRTKSK